MGHFSEVVDVSCTADQAFAYVTDQSRLAEWNDHVQWAEVVDGGQVDVGSRLRQHRRRNNREFDLLFEVTRHDPPQRHEVAGSVFGVHTTMRFDIEPTPTGASVRMTADVTGRGLRRPLAAVVTREMRASTISALNSLRSRLNSP